MRTNWDEFGEQIKYMVDRAVRNGDFADLSRSVGDIVNDSIDAVRETVRDSVRETIRMTNPSRDNIRRWENPHQKVETVKAEPVQKPKMLPALYDKKPQGKLAGILMTAGGYAGLAVFGGLGLGFLVTSLLGAGLSAAAITFGVLAAGSLGVGVKGTTKISFANRYQRYIGLLKQQMYMPIKELAKLTGRSVDATTRDLQKIIDQKYFYQAHIDHDDQYLIMSDDAYKEYVTAKTDYLVRKEEAEALEKSKQQLSPECRKLIEEGQEYIEYIHESNDRIPDRMLTEKLSQMENVITRIFEVVCVHPEVAPDLKKLMSYYLPTTKKLLNAYIELDAQPIEGENISNTKREIEDTIDTLNVAYEKLLDGLYEDKAWDISADISVLNTILAQDGLKEDELTKNR